MLYRHNLIGCLIFLKAPIQVRPFPGTVPHAPLCTALSFPRALEVVHQSTAGMHACTGLTNYLIVMMHGCINLKLTLPAPLT